MKSGLLILLDGTASAGKTSLALQIRKRLKGSIVLSVDRFILRFSNRLRWFLKSKCLGKKPSFLSVAAEFHREAAYALSRHNIVVVDTILLDTQMRNDLLGRVGRNRLLYVQVYCPLEYLEERERHRQPCKIGAARSQFDNVYSYRGYDLKVDTSETLSEDCACAVLEYMESRCLT